MKRLLQHNVQTLHGMYCRVSAGTFLLSLFLSIATIPIAALGFGRKLTFFDKEARQRFLSQLLGHSYALGLISSPLEMVVLAGVDATGANYTIIFLLFFVIIIIFLIAKLIAQQQVASF